MPTSVSRYVPGPQAGSASGKKNDAPAHVVGPSSRYVMPKSHWRAFVLSKTACLGNPEGVWLGDLVCVRVLEGVPVALGLCVWVRLLVTV